MCSMRWARTVLLLTVIGCNGGPPTGHGVGAASPVPPASSPEASPASTSGAPTGCAVTLPHTAPIPELGGLTPLPGNRFSWYGDTTLAVMLPRDGVYRTTSTANRFSAKIPWYRFRTGEVEISAERLDAKADRVRSRTTEGYGGFGFNPSEVTFSSEGCWRVSGDLGGHVVSFVMYVRPAIP